MLTEKNSSFDFDNTAKHTLSMSDAQSLSNLANQWALEIEDRYKYLNNSSKLLLLETFTGSTKQLSKEKAVKLPDVAKVKADFIRKGKLHALQGFLVEHIQFKNDKIEEIQNLKNEYEDFTAEELIEKGFKIPKEPELSTTFFSKPKPEEVDYIKNMTPSEYNDYLINTAIAAHIGMFIHEKGTLTRLRKEIKTEEGLSEFVMQDRRVAIVEHEFHHTAEQLSEVHNLLANEHRDYTRKVNRVKAEAKNSKTINVFEWETEKTNNDIDNKALIQAYRHALKDRNDVIDKINNELRLAYFKDLDAQLSKWIKIKISVPEVFAPLVKDIFGEES